MERLPVSEPVSALRFLLEEAARLGASDVHMEAMDGEGLIRFRMGGALSERFRVSPSLLRGIVVRTKVVAGMDVGESRCPQDGSFSHVIGGQLFDFRVSILPVIYGESIVIRVLRGTVDFIEENRLGMTEAESYLFGKVLSLSHGLVLVSGPTGSGKTSTLYAGLRLVSSPKVKVISIEDPVEYRIPFVSQVRVNEKSGLTFAAGLRAVVRQDPDVLMIGEIRDKETAELAIEAALTGHLVLSSIHTSSVAETPTRLQDMGVAPYLLAAALSLVISQRLVRDISAEEKRAVTVTKEVAKSLFLPEAFVGKTGYEPVTETGGTRRGIFEMLEIKEEARALIYHGGREADWTALMHKEGEETLGEKALREMEAGRISLHEAAVLYEN